MPTFCRHNRFIERCPICSKTLEDPSQTGRAPGSGRPARGGRPAGASQATSAARRGSPLRQGVRVRREIRAEDDGYRCDLLPGLRASSDAAHLAEEIAFAGGRLLVLAATPPSLYGEVRALARTDLERATWACFLIAYLSPLQGEDPFAGIRRAIEATSELVLAPAIAGAQLGHPATLDLRSVPLGPRTSHDPARGSATLLAYRRWVEHAGRPEGPAQQPAGGGQVGAAGAQARAFRGDPQWSPRRRFERLFERLSLPGLGRMGRYDLLVTLGRLGLYELRPDSLHLAGVGASGKDLTTLGAKRVFAIGEPLLLERRAAALAEAVSVPLETLDVALANWASAERATLGVPPDACDREALARARSAFGL